MKTYLSFLIIAGLAVLLSTTCSACKKIECDVRRDSQYFICPARITEDIKAELHLPVKHPQGLLVKTPENEWIYLVAPAIGYSSFKNFNDVNILTFNPSELEGVIYENGERKRVKVFKQSGTYLFYFADNLETEPENTFSAELKVQFLNTQESRDYP